MPVGEAGSVEVRDLIKDIISEGKASLSISTREKEMF